MWKKFKILFLFFFALHAEEFEVFLSTKTVLQPLYLTELYVSGGPIDWRYPEEMRAVLAFDLSHNGSTTLLPSRSDWEKKINWPDPRSKFDASFWNRENIPYVIAVQATQNGLLATVFQIAKGSSKRYPEIRLTGDPEQDRHAVHLLADAIQKDLFHIQGIAAQRILFSERVKNMGPNGPEWFSDIWISDWDGANAKRLTMAKGYCISPGFLPQGIARAKNEFFYVSSVGGQTKIYRSSDCGKNSPMLKLRGSQLLPAIAKNGSQIAFISDAAGRPDLFVQNLGVKGEQIGKARQISSAPFATHASPTYHPDGKSLAFVSDKDGTPRIYIMEIPAPSSTRKAIPKLVTKKNRENTSPAWSPDGLKLAYSARTDGIRQIWIYDFETGEERQLTFGPENKENPSWAPNSLHLVYNTETNDECELFIINLNTKEPVQISTGFGQKRFPSWNLDKEILFH